MADSAVFTFEDPSWTVGPNAAEVAYTAKRQHHLWLFPHLWMKVIPAVGTLRIPGHTVTNSGDPPELSWVQVREDVGAPGDQYIWRADITWIGGVITDVAYQFDDRSGGGGVGLAGPAGKIYGGYVGSPPEAQVPSDATDPNSFFVDPCPRRLDRPENDNTKAFREGAMAMMGVSAMHGTAFESYLITGYTQQIVGDPTAPDEIRLLAFPSQPIFRYSFEYRPGGELWRILVETARDDTQLFYIMDHVEYERDLSGRVTARRSLLRTAAGVKPEPRLGLENAPIDFTPNNNGNGAFFNWRRPDYANANSVGYLSLETVEPITLNWWWQLMVLGWGGRDPLLYQMPPLTTGYPTILFFYDDNLDGAAGYPGAVEIQQGNFCWRYEIDYDGLGNGTITAARWFCDMAVSGAGWFFMGST